MPTKRSLTINERAQLVLALLAKKEYVRCVCRRFGISRQTAYKFRQRFLASGRRGLREWPRGRKCKHERRWAQYRKRLLADRRRHPTRGARKLLWRLRSVYPGGRLPSVRTVERWLQVAGLVRSRRLRRRIAPKSLQRYRRGRRSNEVWTIDWKGWSRTGDQARIEPLTIRDLGSRFLLWNQPVAQRSDQAVRRVCARLFRKHGCPKAMRSDLGSPFCSIGPYGLTSLSLWWYRLGIGVEFARRGAGIDNNAHEQMHAVLQADTATPPAGTRQAQLRRLHRWRHYYNHERPHAGIGHQPPAHRYRSQRAKLPALLVPHYPAHWPVRSVGHRGTIGMYGEHHHVGQAFAGLPVGCKPFGQGCRVYFHRLLLVTLARPLRASLKPSRPNPIKRGRSCAPPSTHPHSF